MIYSKPLRSESFLGSLIQAQDGDHKKLLAILDRALEKEILNTGFWNGRSTRVLRRSIKRQEALTLDIQDIVKEEHESWLLERTLRTLAGVMMAMTSNRIYR